VPDDLTYGGWRRGELITGIVLPAPPPRTGSAYEKFKHPATLYAICGVAASVTLGADGTVSACTVAVAGAAGGPTKLSAIPRALEGKRVDDASLAAAVERIGELRWIGDHFANGRVGPSLADVEAPCGRSPFGGMLRVGAPDTKHVCVAHALEGEHVKASVEPAPDEADSEWRHRLNLSWLRSSR